MTERLGLRDVVATTLAGLVLATAVGIGNGAASAGPASSGHGSTDRGSAIPEPNDGPFYLPPAGYESSAPGTVLRSRPVTVQGMGLPVPADAWQFLVRSTDAKDRPITVAATLMVPTASSRGHVRWSPTSRRRTVSVISAIPPTRCGSARRRNCR